MPSPATFNAERLADAISVSSDGLWEWDIQSNQLTCSDTMLSLLGLEGGGASFSWDKFRALVHPDDRAGFDTALSVEPAQDTFNIKCRLDHAHSGTKWFKLRGCIKRDAQGAPHFATGLLFDISSSESASIAIATQNAQFENLAENVPGALNRYLIQQDGSQTLDYVSPGFYDITELTPEDIAADSTKLWQIMHEDDVAETAASVEAAARDLKHWEQTFRLRTKSGAIKWLHGRGKPWLRQDGVIVFDSVIIDITQLKQTEEELRISQGLLAQAQKFEAIGKLSGGIAHDFNNLLAVIVGNLEMLQEDIQDADLLDMVNPAISASRTGTELVGKMLSFARKAKLDVNTTELNEVVQASSKWVQRTMPANIKLKHRLNRDIPPICIDRTFLENAFLNLVVNACDAMPEGGEIIATTGMCTLSAEDVRTLNLEPGCYVTFALEDNGTGISDENIAKIFEPFFSTKSMPARQGRGMGLAMVDGFMRQSGGAIQVQSTEGQGTKFTLYFQTSDAVSDAETTPDATEEESFTGLKILLAEDEPEVSKIVALMLQRLGHRVLAVPDGDQAFDRLQSGGDFGLLLTDRDMPSKLQGEDLAAEARRLAPNLPIIVMTGYASINMAEASDKIGPHALLQKPIGRAELAQAIETACEQAAELN